jgi:pimeloyl-ACP methyl ester carboxylesterase
VILFDNRGAGESETPPPPWTVPDMAADAVGVLDALGIARAHVLGVSMGGMIAQEMAIGGPSASIGSWSPCRSRVPIRSRRAFLLFRRWARCRARISCRRASPTCRGWCRRRS